MRCREGGSTVLAFAVTELYVMAIVLTILTLMYIVSIIPITSDIIRIGILATLFLIALYMWYRITVKILSSYLAR